MPSKGIRQADQGLMTRRSRPSPGPRQTRRPGLPWHWPGGSLASARGFFGLRQRVAGHPPRGRNLYAKGFRWPRPGGSLACGWGVLGMQAGVRWLAAGGCWACRRGFVGLRLGGAGQLPGGLPSLGARRRERPSKIEWGWPEGRGARGERSRVRSTRPWGTAAIRRERSAASCCGSSRGRSGSPSPSCTSGSRRAS